MGTKKIKSGAGNGRLGRLLLYSVIFSLLLTPMGMVHGANTTITLSQSSGAPGTVIWINGTGFKTSDSVDIYWDSNYQDTVSTDSHGDFSYQFQIPSSTAGQHTISADDGSNSASAKFQVVPEITLSPNNGYVGTSVTVNGEGFSANKRVYVYWDSTYLGRTWTGNKGSFSYTFTVSKSPYGLHTVTARDSNWNTATASFLVLSHIVLSTYSGYYGEVVYYSCTGYSANSLLSVVLDYSLPTSTTLDTKLTDSTGSYDGWFRIPDAAHGNHHITGIDNRSHADDTVLTVQPKVNINPGTGIVGSTFAVSGHGFSANSNVDITWDSGAILNSTVTDNFGHFYATVTVPYSTEGNHQLTATDSNSVQSAATFDVSPHITVTPNYGVPGDSSTVVCTGFSGSTGIHVYWDFGLATQSTLSSGTTNSTGTYTASVTIPTGSNSSHTIAGEDDNNYLAETTYYLGPHIYLSPTSGFVGSTIVVNGTAFSHNSTVSIYWDSMQVATTSTNATGIFTANFTVPDSVYGYHEVMAEDADGNYSTAYFFVLAHIILSSNEGTVFDNISISGTGFSGDSAAYIFWDSTNTELGMLTDDNGSFDLTFSIPESTAGWHSVIGRDVNGVTSDTQYYDVLPMIKLHPDYGNIGSSYTIDCYGFGASTTLNMLWDGNSQAYHATTNSVGSGEINAVVPNATAGVHKIAVYDAFLNEVSPVNFTVLPPDMPVPYAPTGFVNSTNVTLSWSSVNASSTYTLEYSTSPAFANPVVINGIVSNSYSLTGLQDGTTYYWRVAARDSGENLGNYSNVLSFTVDVSAPTSTVSLSGQYTNSTHILVYYQATDSISGVKDVRLYYSYNGRDYELYAISNSSNGVFDFYATHGDGNYSFYTAAYDNAGNIQSVHSAQQIVVDTTPPESYIHSLPQYTANASIILSYSATDVGTGVAHVNIYWSSDGVNWNYYGAFDAAPVKFVAPHDGMYYFKSVAVDTAGNVQAVAPVIVSTMVDTTPPESMCSVKGTVGQNGWYVSTVHLYLSAHDATSGVKAIYYAIGDSSSLPYSGPITLSNDGVYKLTYYAVDFAGNSETHHSIVVKIDREAPTLAIVAPEENAILSGNVTLSVKSSDTNMQGVYYSIDSGSWIALSHEGAIWSAMLNTLNYDDGKHVIRFVANDSAGNTAYSNMTVSVDNKEPTLVNINVPTGIVSGITTISVEVSDSVGVETVIAKLQSANFNGTYTMYKSASSVYSLRLNTSNMKDGSYTMAIIAKNYGGITNEVSTQFVIDNTAPEVKYTGSNVVHGATTLTFEVKDVTSGVKSAWIAIDNGHWVKVTVEKGIIKYKWETMLLDNGVHRVQVKVIDNAGNEQTYEKDIYVNNFNYMPIVYTIILVALLIVVVLLLKKRKTPTPKKPRAQNMSPEPAPDNQANTNAKPSQSAPAESGPAAREETEANEEESMDLPELELGGEHNE